MYVFSVMIELRGQAQVCVDTSGRFLEPVSYFCVMGEYGLGSGLCWERTISSICLS